MRTQSRTVKSHFNLLQRTVPHTLAHARIVTRTNEMLTFIEYEMEFAVSKLFIFALNVHSYI